MTKVKNNLQRLFFRVGGVFITIVLFSSILNWKEKNWSLFQNVRADVPGGDSGDGSGDSGSGGGSGGGCGNGGGGCFKAGTLVAVAINHEGAVSHKNIESLRVGDTVLGVNFNTDGQPVTVEASILKLYFHEPKIKHFANLITTRGAKISATATHPVITDISNGWIRLAELTQNQKVVSAFSQPKWDTVREVHPEKSEFTPVYNIHTVTKNFLASQDGIGWVLVHNMSI